MVPLDYVLAVAVLTAPIDQGKPSTLAEHACLGRALAEVALHWEILDPREARHFFHRPDDFISDLALLRRRYQELNDAPLVSDAQRLPGRETASELLAFNRAYHRTLTMRRDALGGMQDDLDTALCEVDQLYRVWDLVRDARSDCYYVSVRRHALLALRQTLGPAEYYRGQLPPHVPVWRFSRVD